MSETTRAPTVSVIIPAFNAGWCVRKAIDSVLAQDYADSEVIVVNDGSTDDTAAVLASYGSAIRLIDQPNGGMSNARNAGIRAARGEFLAFLDSDDWWLPGKLTQQVELLRRHPELGFCSCAARVEDMEGRLLNLWACPIWQEPVSYTHLDVYKRQPCACSTWRPSSGMTAWRYATTFRDSA